MTIPKLTAPAGILFLMPPPLTIPMSAPTASLSASAQRSPRLVSPLRTSRLPSLSLMVSSKSHRPTTLSVSELISRVILSTVCVTLALEYDMSARGMSEVVNLPLGVMTSLPMLANWVPVCVMPIFFPSRLATSSWGITEWV